MTRQSEFKRKYDPEMGKYKKKHIYGEGIMDSLKSLFKPTPKQTNNPPKPPQGRKVRFDLPSSSAANKKAGDDIVKLLSRESTPATKPSRKKMTQQEINNRVLQIMSGGKLYNY